ncbi:hypothetical protein DAEQUDRAFT_814908 [Daedalea quercina L-15889]|uniref:Uncharacterized protein n=1 Tax=Daedalea quercina L-15889 TaxID=1314783 RepID=A0A165LKW6_9APHY|nr:hypothetical protein DAEQUDRAFT_814908 [Daedalea quercina L-15889]
MASASYPAYADGSSTIYQYYPTGAGTSPVQGDYHAGEASYMTDTQRTHWQAQPASSSSYPASIPAHEYSSSSTSQSMSYPSAYAPHPQHTSLPDAFAPSPSSSSRTYAASTLSHVSASSTPTIPSLQRVTWAAGSAPASALYIVDPEPDVGEVPEGPYTQVKTEEEDFESGFIFELASDAPPTLPFLDNMPEVPLRATQASKEMRKLMGAFRLDPFAMHNGVKSAASQSVPIGIEVGPLREPPIMFEWQVELAYPLVPQSPRWSAEEQSLHVFEDDDEKWAPEGAMDVYGEVFDDEASLDTEATFQPVMTPAQAVGWGVGFNEQQSMVSAASNSPSGYPVQPLSGMFNRSGPSSMSQASISRSLPPLPQPQPTAFYRQSQNYAVSSPSTGIPSPSLSQSAYSQRSTPSNSTDMYYRQQQQQQSHHQQSLHPSTSSASASAAMRVPLLMSSSSAPAHASSMSRRTQLEYPVPHASAPAPTSHPQYASPSPTPYSGSGGGGAGRYRDEALGWYRRPAFALEPYAASACT